MNNVLTDERVPDERLEQFADIATLRGFFDTTNGEFEAMVRELRQRRAADRNYFMYGIAEPDGCAHLGEVCVSRDIGVLQTIADELNINEGTDGYRVVALYTALPLTDDERRELQEYRKASKEPLCRISPIELASLRKGMYAVVDIPSRHLADTPLYTAPQPLSEAERAELQEYRKTSNEPAPPLQAVTVPDGFQLVPVIPTEDMVIAGFESEPDPFFGTQSDWDAYRAMSGCQQAAYRVRMCWTAMLDNAPKPSAASKN
jgi:hypothetical protein